MILADVGNGKWEKEAHPFQSMMVTCCLHAGHAGSLLLQPHCLIRHRSGTRLASIRAFNIQDVPHDASFESSKWATYQHPPEFNHLAFFLGSPRLPSKKLDYRQDERLQRDTSSNLQRRGSRLLFQQSKLHTSHARRHQSLAMSHGSSRLRREPARRSEGCVSEYFEVEIQKGVSFVAELGR